MAFGIGKSDAAFRMMNTANSQLSAIRNAGPESDTYALAQQDKQFAINNAKDELTYMVMEKMEEQHDKLQKDKIKRSFSYFQ